MVLKLRPQFRQIEGVNALQKNHGVRIAHGHGRDRVGCPPHCHGASHKTLAAVGLLVQHGDEGRIELRFAHVHGGSAHFAAL